ncbi:MAG TPA: Tim44 domain-containing protein [Terriglobales bacterium]|nr:Tim44 domain-containing protein [Terriglobales bacterium]
MFGGLMGGLAGFALGGLLGSMLFGGMGGLGAGFGGIGLMDILLIGGGIALLVMFMRRRRAAAETPQPAYAGMGGGYGTPREPVADTTAATTATVTAAPVETTDVDRGLAHIRSMDARFDAGALVAAAREMFFDVQGAVTARDMSSVRERVTPEMYDTLEGQCQELRAGARTNRVERVDLRRSEVTEAWQESGRDYVTVFFEGALLDYTVDDQTGAVLSGSKTERQGFEEFWTFSRPVGPNSWRLSAIQSA